MNGVLNFCEIDFFQFHIFYRVCVIKKSGNAGRFQIFPQIRPWDGASVARAKIPDLIGPFLLIIPK